MNKLDKSAFSVDQITESEYVLGIRKYQANKVIDVQLPNDWIIPDALFPKDTQILIGFDEGTRVFSFYSETKQFSDIFQVINEVVRYNKEIEEKSLIFNKLQSELQKYFEQLPLENFKLLTIGTKANHPFNDTITPPPPVKEREIPVVPPEDRSKLNEGTDILKEANADIQAAIKETGKDGEVLKS